MYRDTAYGKLKYRNGIYSVYLTEGLELTPEILEDIHINGREMSGGEQHCVVADVSRNVSSTIKARAYAADNEYMVNHIAYAMIGKTLSVNMLANFFIRFNKPRVPTRLFNNEEAAIKWLIKMSGQHVDMESRSSAHQ